MAPLPSKKINQDIFKTWTQEMSYLLGYIIADGCISVDKTRKNKPYSLNITSKDKKHLYKLRSLLGSSHKISNKSGSTGGAFQIQIRNQTIADDLIKLEVFPRRTYNLDPVKVPEKYFSDFVRGFFDGDGTVYLYRVNDTPQIKSGFVCASRPFLEDINSRLCKILKIPIKNLHIAKAREKRVVQYSVDFYVEDSEKLGALIYAGCADPRLYLNRKKLIFDKWQQIKRRKFIKKNYPSKIGWHLNPNL